MSLKHGSVTSTVDDGLDLGALVVLALVGSLLSVIATGYLLGVRNDIYYLPILHNLYDKPQFANDAFIQTLRYFSSGVWLSLKGVGNYIDPYWLLFGLNILSRFIAFAGFLACATLLGINKRKEAILLTAFLCATSLLRGQSLAGDGGLFINYFTHSEIANGLTLLILYMLIRGWLVAALLTNGAIIFVNAFIGVWDAAMIGAVMFFMAANGKISWREILIKGSIGTLLALLLAAPVIRNILTNPDLGKPIDFDYIAYLEQFWPYHFIFWDIPAREWIGLASITALGCAALSVNPSQKSRYFLAAIVAFLAVYCAGIIAPHITQSALVLNLHLLRVSTMLQLLAAFGAIVLATRWWFSDDDVLRHAFAPTLALLLCTPIRMVTIQPAFNAIASLFIIALAYRSNIRLIMPARLSVLKLRYFSLAAIAIGFIAVAANDEWKNVKTSSWLNEWTTVANWAKSNTSPNVVFLIPTWNFQGRQTRIQPGTSEDDATINAEIFETVAQRVVWIDFRNGAAVLWSPSYYHQWYARILAVNSLPSAAAADAFKKQNGIQYSVDLCSNDPKKVAAFSTKRLCVYRTPA